jgi:hypothetical protein
MASKLKVDELEGVTTAGSIDVTSGSTTTNLQQGLAKVVVNFNGTGTVAIRNSMNATSITDNGTGNYTVNFTNNMGDADYSPAAFTEQIAYHNGHTRTASAYQFIQLAHDAAVADITHGGLSNFGDLA